MSINECHAIPGLQLGKNVSIHPTAEFLIEDGGIVKIGDYCVIGPGVRIVCGGSKVTIDDWTVLHDRTLVLAENDCLIGQHCWFGQGCVIDATGGLNIEDSVRVGMYSQIWSHVAAGELFDGCVLFSKKPVTIKKNAWLVGTCYVGSGVEIGEYAVCLLGSNVTKNIPPHSVVAGSPAVVRERLNFYRDISLDDKVKLIISWIKEYNDRWVINKTENYFEVYSENDLKIFEFSHDGLFPKNRESGVTYVDISLKKYIKSYSIYEHALFKYLSGHKVRFLEFRDDKK
jgi:acetyltransferase-like isoleucine patch superfamily enzyme